ncbi:MAG: metallophosphoesterase [Desulfobacterota bacterium]|nr:metallophosphoesterase [Thermodesulfobacteriota bacterium]
MIGYLQDYLNLPPRPLVGNWPSNVSALKEEGFPFSFLVIGDTSGSATSETLIEKALKKDHPSFLVILGDFVKKPDLWNHRFFLTEMTAEIAPPFPVFLVAGNHDIDYTGSNIRRKDRGVTPEIYESLYGERNFDFIFNDCLFIICGVDVKSPHLFLAHLRKTLLLKGRGREHIFVFIHYPPKGLADHIEGSLPVPREEEFLGLLEEYKVTACFFGDYHGHWRGQKGGVNLIVSGGGGRLKPSQPEWGKFHHILKITVEPKKIVEEVITAPQQFGLEDRFEEWVFTNIFPSLGTSLKVYYLIFIGLIVVAGGFLLQLNRSLRIFPKRLSSQKENLSENHP